MRILEVSMIVGLLAHIIYLLSPGRMEYVWLGLVVFVCLPLLVVHLIVEGYRWQMVPVYLALCACLLCQALPSFLDVQASFLVGLIALCFLGAGIVLGTVFPVFQLPLPTGSHVIGTRIRHLIDANRRDPSEPDSPRELMIQIWYPAQATAGRIAPYREVATTGSFDRRFSLVKTHSMLDAPLSASRAHYPLLLYMPSWDGLRTENTSLAEDLASHGYVVVAIDHPYSSLATVFPDGRIIESRLLNQDFFSSDAAFESFLTTAEAQIRLRADDAKFVLDDLQAPTESGWKAFANRVDLDRVGIFGFSLGGGVAAQACWLDRRFKACVNMDGMMAAESFEQGTRAPYLVMAEADPPPPDSMPNASPSKRRELVANFEQFVQMRKLLATRGGSWLTIPRTRHFNFSDDAFSSPLRFYSRAGAIPPAVATGIIRRYLRAFFDQYLEGVDRPLLDELHSQGGRFEQWKNSFEHQR